MSIMDTLAGHVEEITQVKNPIVIYHSNCADGFSAAWVFYKMQDILEQNFDFYPGVYNELPPDVEGRDVFLVDFSYKRAVVEKMLETANTITLIDHHKTAIDDLYDLVAHKNFYSYTDLERSGAMLAYDFWADRVTDLSSVFPKPLLLGHIEDRDLWRFKLPNTREIQANVFSFEYTFENWDKLMNAGQAELLQMTVAGAAIERKHHKDIRELVNVCRRFMDIGGFVVPVASLPYTLTSDAGHLLAAEYEEGTKFAACYWDTPTHRIFSLRSCDNGMDVSEIAKQYNGGGHKHAAGFRVARDHALARS